MCSNHIKTRRSDFEPLLNSTPYPRIRLHTQVGGAANGRSLKSVEYYDPTLDAWTPVADMSLCRQGVGVGVLNGLIYAIGGYSRGYFKSVEVYRPSNEVWSYIADMHSSKFCPGVVALDGLLYVMSGESDTVEIYNPNTNTWTMEKLSRPDIQI